MPVTVKRIALSRSEVENKRGILATALEPLASAGANLRVVMGYRYPGDPGKAAIELYPVRGKKSIAAAQAAGLKASAIPTLLVEGDDKPGLGCAIARAIADAGINLSFLVAQVIGKKYSAVIGLETEADASKAAAVVKKVSAGRKK